jgi:hypothetical protein
MGRCEGGAELQGYIDASCKRWCTPMHPQQPDQATCISCRPALLPGCSLPVAEDLGLESLLLPELLPRQQAAFVANATALSAIKSHVQAAVDQAAEDVGGNNASCRHMSAQSVGPPALSNCEEGTGRRVLGYAL